MRSRTTRVAYMRYIGQGHEIPVDLPSGALKAGSGEVLRRRFETGYEALYGRTIPHLGVEIMSWTVTVAAGGAAGRKSPTPGRAKRVRPDGQVRAFEMGSLKHRDVPVCDRTGLPTDAVVPGPALIVEDQTTTVVGASYRARIDSLGYIVLDRVRGGA